MGMWPQVAALWRQQLSLPWGAGLPCPRPALQAALGTAPGAALHTTGTCTALHTTGHCTALHTTGHCTALHRTALHRIAL